jgi:two-component system, OmpR family, sensor kinase
VNLRSLRFKLIWLHSAAIGLVVVCIGLVRYQAVSYRSQQNFNETLLRDGRYFDSKIYLGRTGFQWALDDLNVGDSLTLRELELLFVVTDVKGNVIARSSYSQYMQTMLSQGVLKSVLSQQDGFSEARTSDGSAYRFVSLKSRPGVFPDPVVLHIGRSLDSLERFLEEYRVLYMYSVPLILAISCAVGWFLAGRALKPFEEITRTAERITYENLNTQITTDRKEEEVQRLVHSFNSMVRRLDESFQKMRKFNADVAHELRTPLAILQGETEVALRAPNLSEEIQSVLISNLEELDRLTRLVNDMLTLAEAEAGRHVMAKAPVNLRSLLQDLIDQMRLLATIRNIQIELQGPEDLWVDADQPWLRRAFVNLLDNAIKYSRDGGKVTLSIAIEGPAAILRIKDDGIGISSEDIPRVFDRLYRADPARSRVSGGTGLGLTMVKWIVEAHKGTIQVTSQPDKGAVFKVAIPVAHC